MSPVRNFELALPREAELARELGAVVASRRRDHQLVPLEVRDPPEVDVRAAVLGGADGARDVLGQQVVDRDAVLVAVHVDHRAEHEQREHERGADGGERAAHGHDRPRRSRTSAAVASGRPAIPASSATRATSPGFVAGRVRSAS